LSKKKGAKSIDTHQPETVLNLSEDDRETGRWWMV